MDWLDDIHKVSAGVLEVAYLECGPADGPPVVLVHGFPYDVHAYAEVAPRLAAEGCRVIVPYMRGYGPTRFLDDATPRSGEQAAFGADLLALLDALAIPSALLGGYDWGGRACCVVAALWPERCAGLVTVNGYNIQSIATAGEPLSPDVEHRLWYQYYFHAERGQTGLTRHRREIARLLWSLWSPTWTFDDATFAASAAAFDNPDFVAVVIHSYRHRFGLVPGDPRYAEIEARLAQKPLIGVPTIAMDGAADGVAQTPDPAGLSSEQRARFGDRFEHRVLAGIGHNLPQEAPDAFADAVLALRSRVSALNDDEVRVLSEQACFGGTQGFYEHRSRVIGLPMRFGVYVPPQAKLGPVPVVFFLAGLTCTHETFALKAGAQRYAAELGLMLVTPDTSPRDTGIEGADAAWDFGTGAGFYLDATAAPWSAHWRMGSYVADELRALVVRRFAARDDRVGIFGHSMGGHGALTLALAAPERYRSVSAFAPIAAPMHCPWGVKAFTGYLGDDREAWARHDASALVAAGARVPSILIDQGLADQFLQEQLQPERFETACRTTGQPLTLRRHPGYDHGYWFVSSFVGDHLTHHAELLRAP